MISTLQPFISIFLIAAGIVLLRHTFTVYYQNKFIKEICALEFPAFFIELLEFNLVTDANALKIHKFKRVHPVLLGVLLSKYLHAHRTVIASVHGLEYAENIISLCAAEFTGSGISARRAKKVFTAMRQRDSVTFDRFLAYLHPAFRSLVF